METMELIKIQTQTINEEMIRTVSARELHEFLGVKSRYNDWIRNRINKYGFLENQDFVCLTKSLVTLTNDGRQGNSVVTEHFLTLGMAKELAMVENNDKGREARQYFIQCEKELKEVLSPKRRFLLNVLDAETDIERAIALNEYELGYVKPLEEELSKQKITNGQLAMEVVKHGVKAAFYDDVLATQDLMTVTEIAQDYGMTARQLNQFLADKGIQYKQRGHWRLYAKYVPLGLAKTYTHICTCSEFKDHCTLTLKWTQKGREFIHKLLGDLDERLTDILQE